MANLPIPPIGDSSTGILARVDETKPFLPQEIVNNIILGGDLSKLTPDQKAAFYVYRCRMLGLDPASKPFDLLKLNGKEVLYANKSCATNLRALNKISTQVLEEREWNGLIVFRVKAWYPDGRSHEDEGFASLAGLGGDALGNARLKAMTKATRRAILNLCGLGELDETEVDSIPGAQKHSAFSEARAAIAVPQLPVTGSDVITIAGVKWFGKQAEVTDTNGGVWAFVGDAAALVATVDSGQNVMLDYTIEDGQYVVRHANV